MAMESEKPDEGRLNKWIDYKFDGGGLSFRAFSNRLDELIREMQDIYSGMNPHDK